jgi:hypothetical protein
MKIAAVTTVYNERHFLPMWIAHYGAALGRENLYVVDDGSTDGSTDRLGTVNVARRAKLDKDEERRANMMSDLHGQLLGRYEAVLFADVDELLLVDPRTGLDLAGFIAGHVTDYVTTFGLNVVFDPTREQPLDSGVPLFAQRNLVQFDRAYCKPLVSRVPIRWKPGFHRSNVPPKHQRELYLIHLRAADRAIASERIRNFHQVPHSENSRRKGLSRHLLESEEVYLAMLFPEPAEFVMAAPASSFDTRVNAILAMLRDRNEAGAYQKSFLRLPERFRDTIRLS